ncbi:hypothetical protein SAMN02745146_2285 [Hymenobacter daecheongensis DSM 21074]|uniref:Uncharacterized protein n=1 Tax=Hymenobacter daecheongensis DSM 21074 TaxID=1121955 RepID=A0A1M6GJI7_9BACT|nr:hypothetical protein [Hymenobacter daecheongensis]SHJ10086.1 hypothetical protein SAMN02745146_2285 [Hymenobacter daecheongensis DSM 21074]
MKGFIEFSTKSSDAGPASQFRPALIALDSIAYVSYYGESKSRITLKTIGAYGDKIVNDILIIDLSFADLKDKLRVKIQHDQVSNN